MEVSEKDNSATTFVNFQQEQSTSARKKKKRRIKLGMKETDRKKAYVSSTVQAKMEGIKKKKNCHWKKRDT